jgi:hypothetical protein
MSLTFASTAAVVTGVRHDCFHDSTSWTVPVGADLRSFTAAHDARCADCRAFGGMLATRVLDVEELSVPDTTAAELFGLLGLPADTTPTSAIIDGEDFLGRALVALALMPETVGVTAQGHSVDVRSRRAPSLLESHLTQLCRIGQHAADRGACVTWG